MEVEYSDKYWSNARRNSRPSLRGKRQVNALNISNNLILTVFRVQYIISNLYVNYYYIILIRVLNVNGNAHNNLIL